MISFKFGFSIFVFAFVSRCLTLPVDRQEISSTTILPLTEQKPTHQDAVLQNEILSSSPSTGKDVEILLTSSTPLANDKSDFNIQGLRSFDESTTSEIVSLATEETPSFIRRSHIQGHDDLSEIEQTTTDVGQSQLRDFKFTMENQTETETSQFDDHSSTTTSTMHPSTTTTPFTSSSSSSSPTTTIKLTEKYQGLLQDEHEESRINIKSTDRFLTTTHENDETEYYQEKNVKEPKILKAEYDPQASDLVATLGNTRMFHDENKMSISDVSKSPKSNEEQGKSRNQLIKDNQWNDQQEKVKTLDQGENSSIFEEKKPNH